ncbi:hydroxypyruvate isomerase [Halomonas elongata]|uniref:Hydroxypyruvate isomerase n=1 Tax=Halomonas elongata TaxID=2746 RepID=A0A1B8P676_HALEL|nr:hydroxypyruvate isomerase [Halomonas elongata]
MLFNLPAGDWGAGERGIACHPDRVEEFRAGVDRAIEYAKVLGNTQVNCLAGIQPEGVSDDEARKSLVDNLRFAAEKLEAAGILLIAEPINTRDIPGFFLNRTEQALAIFDEVGSQNLKLQYDIYHMQIMEGDLAPTIEKHLGRIAHVQLADNPVVTSRARARSTIPSCSVISIAWAMTAGSAASTSRPGLRRKGWAGWMACAET